MSRRIHVGFFENPHDLLSAARECRERGVAILDARTPFPIHGIDDVIGIPRSRLGFVCCAFGAAGLFLGLLLQHWTSAVDWPINVGGKPFDSLPAFVPVGFEIMILLAGLGTAGAFLVRSRLRPGRKEPINLERVTDDRFALVVEEKDAALPGEEYALLWRRHGAVDAFVERIES